MKLAELKSRLEIPAENTKRDATLQVFLDDAIEVVVEHCGQDFKNDFGDYEMPGAVKHAIRIIVQGMDSNEAIQADSVAGGMSKTLIQGGYLKAAKQYLKPFRRVRVIQWGNNQKYQ